MKKLFSILALFPTFAYASYSPQTIITDATHTNYTATVTSAGNLQVVGANACLETGGNLESTLSEITTLTSGSSTISTNQTNGSQKTQQVDGSGNIAPVGDIAARAGFVHPTDGTNSQSYSALGEAKAVLTTDSVSKVNIQDGAGTPITSTLISGTHQAMDVNAVGVTTATVSDLGTSGTITTICITPTSSCPAGSYVQSDINGVATTRVQIEGTFGGASLNVYGSLDNTNWLILGTAIGVSAQYTTSAITATGEYRVFRIAGFSHLRVIATALLSGSVSVMLNSSVGSNLVESVQQTAANLVSSSWLSDGSGNAISSTSGSLNANVTNIVPVSQSGTWNLNNISGTVSLPTGAATAGNQTTGNASLSSIDGKLASLGQKTSVGSIPVVIASDQSAVTVAQATAANLNATVVGTGGVALARDSSLSTINTTLGSPFQAGGSIGNTTFASTQSGIWNITNVSGTVSLPTNAAQETGGHLASIDTKLGTGPVAQDSTVSGLQVTQGSTTSGEKGSLVQGAVTGVAPTYTTAQTSPLSLNTSGGLRVDGSGVTQPVSGTVSANQSGTWNVTNISGTVSLPTGASTSANQTNGSQETQIVQGGNTATVTAASALKVDGSAVTQPVSGTITANQGTSPWVDNISQFGGVALSTGTGASGTGIPRVTVANDSNILATQSGTWNITNVSGTVSLPTGAATSANQTNASQKTQVVDGSGNVIGSTSISSVNYLDVKSASAGATGSTVPSYSTYVGGTDGTNLQGAGVQSLTTNPPSGSYYLQVMPMTYSFKNLAGAATTTVKSGAGILHEFCINNNDVSATATIYDNTAGSGTIIGTLTETLGGGANISSACILHDINFSTGLTVVTTGTTANFTAVYK